MSKKVWLHFGEENVKKIKEKAQQQEKSVNDIINEELKVFLNEIKRLNRKGVPPVSKDFWRPKSRKERN